MRLVLFTGLLTTTLFLHVTRAEGQAEDQATARALFNDARELMKQERFGEACPKLEAASKLYSGAGVLLNLGDCYEHLGRTASAWNEFGEAASTAERAGRPTDMAEALHRQRLVEPRLCRLAVSVSSRAPGLVVTRDGIHLDRGAWGVAVPVDPGRHTITAEAAGYDAWSLAITVDRPAETETVEVPELRPQTPALVPIVVPTPSSISTTQPARPAAPPTDAGRPRRIVAVSVAGVGLVSMGIGGIAGLVAKSKYTSATSEAGTRRHDDSIDAVNTGNAATVFVVAGAATVVAGVVLWFTAPSSHIEVGLEGGRVRLEGRF